MAVEKEVVISTSKSIPRRDIARSFPFQMPPLWGRAAGESPLLASNASDAFSNESSHWLTKDKRLPDKTLFHFYCVYIHKTILPRGKATKHSTSPKWHP